MENNDIVLETTLEETNEIEKDIQENINHYYHDQDKIETRLAVLDQEMDLETYLQNESTALTIAGIVLGLTVSKKWLLLPLVTSIIALNNINRKNAPLSFFRNMGLRSRLEIDKEKYALKALRGDFKYLLDVPNAVWTAVNK